MNVCPVRFPPRSGEARDESSRDRVAKRDRDNRERPGCVLRRLGGRSSGYNDDVRHELQTFASKSRESLSLAISRQVIDSDGLAVNITLCVSSTTRNALAPRRRCPSRAWSLLCSRGRPGAKRRVEPSQSAST